MALNLITILSRGWPEATFSGSPDNYASLRRNDGGVMPTLEEIEAQRDSVEAEIAAEVGTKVWENVAEFYSEFTDAEQYGVQSSQSPPVVVARGKLSMWRGSVATDSPLVVDGLALLVTEGLLTEARRTAILTPV